MIHLGFGRLAHLANEPLLGGRLDLVHNSDTGTRAAADGDEQRELRLGVRTGQGQGTTTTVRRRRLKGWVETMMAGRVF